jgi:enhancer of polycomb-like protein
MLTRQQEYHLQAVLHGPGASTQKEIPVPPPQESQANYGELYSRLLPDTKAYIRFSATVEESIGCLYDMTEEDDAFLEGYNQGRPPQNQLSEDNFEAIMEVFEDTAAAETPFAAVDNTVVTYDRMVPGLQELRLPRIMPHVKLIYEHWQGRRQAMSNRPLHPSLKFETHQDSDDLDPYVCFRRREVRQTRKTRARDTQTADRLKRLRRELEEGRDLVLSSHKREAYKREMLATDKMIFEHRANLKTLKLRLGIKENEEDLIHTKVSTGRTTPLLVQSAHLTDSQREKRKVPDLSSVPRPGTATQLRLPIRPDGFAMEITLPLLSARIEDRDKDLVKDVEVKIENHRKWNKNHVDVTREPMSPVQTPVEKPGFRRAQTYLITPPTSASDDSLEEPTEMQLDQPAPPAIFQFRGLGESDVRMTLAPSFRRRIGRLNRTWIDRRGLASPRCDSTGDVSDRWKYDRDSDDDEDPPIYEVDPFDTRALRFRASIPLTQSLVRRPGPAENPASGPAHPNGVVSTAITAGPSVGAPVLRPS